MTFDRFFYKFIGLFFPQLKHFRYYAGGYCSQKDGQSIIVKYKGKKISCKNFEQVKEENNILNIICSGPSLNNIQGKDKLFDSDSLCMNGSHNLSSSEHEFINYYVISDVGFIRRNWVSFCSGVKKSENLFFDHRVIKEIIDIDPEVLSGKNIYLFNLMTRPYRRKSEFSSKKQYFSTDPDLGLNPSRTVAYLSLQIAVALGYKDIRFFGMDLGGNQRFYADPVNEKSMIDQDYPFIEADFRFASQYCRQHGIIVTNASPNSRLPDDIFQKADPDVILARV